MKEITEKEIISFLAYMAERAGFTKEQTHRLVETYIDYVIESRDIANILKTAPKQLYEMYKDKFK